MAAADRIEHLEQALREIYICSEYEEEASVSHLRSIAEEALGIGR